MEDQLISSPVQSKEMANARNEFCFWAASALTAEKGARLEEAEDPRQHIHGRTTSWEGCRTVALQATEPLKQWLEHVKFRKSRRFSSKKNHNF